MAWTTIQRPGYLGKKRDELSSCWNKQFGEGNWRIVWEFGKLTIQRPEALQVYEDGYYEFLKSNPETLDWLVKRASNVYDTAPTNIQAGVSYNVQETANNHLHDVAIRRAVFRLGKWFEGTELLEVRSKAEGWRLSPCMVPFHLPELISTESIMDYGNKGFWWDKKGVPNSVEAFYQRNKLLQAYLE